MKRLIYIITGFLFLFTGSEIYGQNEETFRFSLKEAQEYAVKNSYKTRGAALDVEIAKKQVKNYTAVGLPQINASAKYLYYIDIPTQLMPDFLSPAIAGVLMKYGLIPPGSVDMNSEEKIPVQFGSKNNFTADASLNQLIFDGTYIIGLKTAKVYVELTRTSLIKSQQEIRETVTQTYQLILVAEQNKKVLDSALMEFRNMYKQILAYRKSGFRDTTDVEQMELLIAQNETRLAMVTRQIEMAYDLLKFQMGIDLNKTLILTDNLQDILNQALAANLVSKPFEPQNHIDYKILQTSNTISRLQYKMDKYKYLPTLMGFGSLSYNAQRNEFSFFKSGSDYPWFRSSILGFSLTVPIWSSGARYYKVQMGKFTVEKNEMLLEQAKQGMLLEEKNAKAELKTCLDDYQNQLRNLDLAHRIYKRSFIAFREGVISSMELTQAHNQYLSVEAAYIDSLMKLLNANSRLNKALNNY